MRKLSDFEVKIIIPNGKLTIKRIQKSEYRCQNTEVRMKQIF
jgi:hypothetical protein